MVELFEDFEGGTDGAVVSTDNTGFEGIDQFPSPYTNPDLIFTSAEQHSGTLSMTAKITIDYGFGHVEYPFTGDVPVGEPFLVTFWFRFTGLTAAVTHDVWQAIFGTAGTPREDASSIRFNLGFEDGVPIFSSSETTETFTLPADTWLRAEIDWSGDGVLSATVGDGAGTTYFEHTEPAVSPFLDWSNHAWPFLREGDFQNWLDDIGGAPVPDQDPLFVNPNLDARLDRLDRHFDRINS